MKIFLFILIPLFSIGQRLDIKTVDGIQYKIKRDTSTNGIITAVYIPVLEVGKELDSSINSIDGQLLEIDNQIIEMQKQKSELNLQRKQLVALKTKLGL